MMMLLLMMMITKNSARKRNADDDDGDDDNGDNTTTMTTTRMMIMGEATCTPGRPAPMMMMLMMMVVMMVVMIYARVCVHATLIARIGLVVSTSLAVPGCWQRLGKVPMRSLINPIPRRIYRPPRIIIRFCCDIRPAWRICLCCDVRLACSIFPPPRRAPPLASNDVGRRVQRPWFTHARVPTSNRKLLPGRKLQSSGYLWGGNLRTHCAIHHPTLSMHKHARESAAPLSH